MTQYVKEKVEKIERPVTAWILIAAICVLGGAYAFFLSGAIANVIAAKDLTSNASALTTAVGDLEARYLAAKSSVDLAYAYSLGFVGAKSDTIYIAKRGSASLSINR